MPDETTMSVGASLLYATTVGGSYTAVTGVRNIDWAGKRGSSDASALVNTVMIKKPKGRRDPGTITFDAIYGKTQYATLYALHNAGTIGFFKISLPDGSILGPYAGHFTAFGLKVPEDDPVTVPAEIDLTGGQSADGTFTPG